MSKEIIKVFQNYGNNPVSPRGAVRKKYRDPESAPRPAGAGMENRSGKRKDCGLFSLWI